MRNEEIYVFAIDYICTKDGVGKWLELNASENASVSAANIGLGADIYADKVTPHLRKLWPDVNVAYGYGAHTGIDKLLEECLDTNPEWQGIILPGYSGNIDGVSARALQVNESNSNIFVANASIRHQTIFNNKAFLSEIANDCGATHKPFTKNYLTSLGSDDLVKQIMSDFRGYDDLIIKPVNDEQGRGVFALTKEDIKDVIPYIFQRDMDWQNQQEIEGPAMQYWNENAGRPLLQVQEALIAKPTIHNEQSWNTTKRAICSVAVYTNKHGERVTDVKMHGGYEKFPRQPIPDDGNLTQGSMISFSTPRNIIEYFCNFSIPNYKKLPMYLGVIESETRFIKEDLEKIFTHLDGYNEHDLYTSFSEHQDPVRRGMAFLEKENLLPSRNSEWKNSYMDLYIEREVA